MGDKSSPSVQKCIENFMKIIQGFISLWAKYSGYLFGITFPLYVSRYPLYLSDLDCWSLKLASDKLWNVFLVRTMGGSPITLKAHCKGILNSQFEQKEWLQPEPHSQYSKCQCSYGLLTILCFKLPKLPFQMKTLDSVISKFFCIDW